MHFGTILEAFWGPFWLPFGALWAPFGVRLSSILHLGGTLVALCALWWCPLGFFSVPSGIFVAFSLDVVAFPCILSVCFFVSMDFKCILLCLAVTGGFPSFFQMILNKRSARASEASRARSSSSNPRLESVIAYSCREWHSRRFKLLMLTRAPAKVYF